MLTPDRIAIAILLALLFALTGCVDKTALKKNMADVERAYVAALALSNSEAEPVRPKLAMRMLLGRWEAFYDTYARKFPAESDIAALMADVRPAIHTAIHDLDNGDPAAAHKTVEGIRTSFMLIRKEMDIWSIMDEFTAYHAAMKRALRMARDGEITPPEMDELRRLAPELAAMWRSICDARFDASMYGMDEAGAKLMRSHMREGLAANTAFAAAVESENTFKLASLANALKPPYAKTFRSFGDFTNLM